MKRKLSEVQSLFNEQQTNRLIMNSSVAVNGLKDWLKIGRGIASYWQVEEEIVNIMELNNISEIDCTM